MFGGGYRQGDADKPNDLAPWRARLENSCLFPELCVEKAAVRTSYAWNGKTEISVQPQIQ
jgi:hypothetical protein